MPIGPGSKRTAPLTKNPRDRHFILAGFSNKIIQNHAHNWQDQDQNRPQSLALN